MKRKIIVTVIALVIAAATAHWYYSDRGRFTTVAELNNGGANAARWPEIEQAHLDRSKATLTMLPLATAQ